MAKVLGIGGVFFKAADPRALANWYARVLGVELAERFPGAKFSPLAQGVTVWSPMARDTSHMAPSTLPFMLNFVVDDLDALVARIEAEDVSVIDRNDADAYGRFAWILDPEGMKLELWQPA